MKNLVFQRHRIFPTLKRGPKISENFEVVKNEIFGANFVVLVLLHQLVKFGPDIQLITLVMMMWSNCIIVPDIRPKLFNRNFHQQRSIFMGVVLRQGERENCGESIESNQKSVTSSDSEIKPSISKL